VANPGAYSPYVDASGWPFTCFFVSIPLLALLLFAVLVFIARTSRRQIIVGILVAVLSLAGLGGTCAVMLTASAHYSASDATKHARYVQQVRTWLESQHVTATDSQVRDMLGGTTTEVIKGGDVVAGRIVSKRGLIHFVVSASAG
jgi:hypothetical protein